MTRRFHTPKVVTGLNPLDARQGKHARDVLRLEDGTEVELFDDAGTVAAGELVYDGNKAAVRVHRLDEPEVEESVAITVAAAIPKGERADWMVEKLSELGVNVFIPLATERGVVVPEGTHKLERWLRIATESAKQCRRRGVMRIESVTQLAAYLARPVPELAGRICLTTERPAMQFYSMILAMQDAVGLTLFIGPEGGWSDSELDQFEKAGVEFARLTENILRIETAAIAAAAFTAMRLKS